MAHVRRKFSDEFEQEAVRLVTVRGVSMSQASRDLGVQVNLLHTWVRTATADAASAAAGGQSTRQDQAELTRLCKEMATLRTERNIQKKSAADSIVRRNTFNQNVFAARSVTQHAPLSLTIPSASTIRFGDTPPWSTLAPCNLKML